MGATVEIFNNDQRVAITSRAFDCHTVHELMRMYTLKFSLANTDAARKYIVPGAQFICDGQAYDLTGFKKASGSTNNISVEAEHVGFHLLKYKIQPGYSFVGTVYQIASDILKVAVDENGVSAESEFIIGTTPDLGTISFSLNNTDVVTAKYAIMALKNIGAESDFDNFTINFAQQIGGGQTQTFEFGVNMANVAITYSLTNGTTYEVDIADLQIKDPQDHPFDIGWYGHGIDSTTGEEFTKRIITYDKCHDDPTKNKITLGVFVSDVSTETAQMSIDIDNSIKQGESYNNNSISRKDGIRSTDSTGNKIIQMGGTNGLELFVKQSDGTLKRVGYFDYDGLATGKLIGIDEGATDTFATIGKEDPQYGEALGLFLYHGTTGDNKFFQVYLINDSRHNGAQILSLGPLSLFAGGGIGTGSAVVVALDKDTNGSGVIKFATEGTQRGQITNNGWEGWVNGYAGINADIPINGNTWHVHNGMIIGVN